MSVNKCCCTPPPKGPPIGRCCFVTTFNDIPTPDCVDGVDEIFCSSKTSSSFTPNEKCGDKVLCSDSTIIVDDNTEVLTGQLLPSDKAITSMFSQSILVSYIGNQYSSSTSISQQFLIGSDRADNKVRLIRPYRNTRLSSYELIDDTIIPSDYNTIYFINRVLHNVYYRSNGLNSDAGVSRGGAGTSFILMHKKNLEIDIYSVPHFLYLDVDPAQYFPVTERLQSWISSDYAQGAYRDFYINLTNDLKFTICNFVFDNNPETKYSKVLYSKNKYLLIFHDSDNLNRGGRIVEHGSYADGAAVKAEDSKEYAIAVENDALPGIGRVTEPYYVTPSDLSLSKTLDTSVLEGSDYYKTLRYIQAIIDYYSCYDHTRANERYDKVSSLTNVIDAKQMQNASCALTSDGNVFSWGNPLAGGDDIIPEHLEVLGRWNALPTKRYFYFQSAKSCLGENLQISGDCIKIESTSDFTLVWRNNNKLSIIFSFQYGDDQITPGNTALENFESDKATLQSWQNGEVEFDTESTFIKKDEVLEHNFCVIKEKKTPTQSGRIHYFLGNSGRVGDDYRNTKFIMGSVESPSSEVKIKKIIDLSTTNGYDSYVRIYLILWDNGRLELKSFNTVSAPTVNNLDYWGRYQGLYSEGYTTSRTWDNIKDIFRLNGTGPTGWGFIGDDNYPSDYKCVIYASDPSNWLASNTSQETYNPPQWIKQLNDYPILRNTFERIRAEGYYFFRITIADIADVVDSSSNRLRYFSIILKSKLKIYQNQRDDEFSLFFLKTYPYASSTNTSRFNLFQPITRVDTSDPSNGQFAGDVVFTGGDFHRDHPFCIYSNGNYYGIKEPQYHADPNNPVANNITIIKYTTNKNIINTSSLTTFAGCEDLCDICRLPFHRCNSLTGTCEDCLDNDNNFICNLDNIYPISHTIGTCASNPCPPPDTPGCCCKTFFTGTPNSISVQDPVLDDSDCVAKGATIYTPQGDPISDSEVSFSFKPFDDTFTVNDCLNAAVTPFCSNPDNPTPSDGLSYRITNVEYSEYNGPNVNGTRFTFTVEKLNPNVTGRINIRGCSYSKLTGGNIHSIGTSSVPPDDNWTTYSFSSVNTIPYSQISNLDFTWVAGKDIAELDQQLPSCNTSNNEPQN